MMTPTPPPQPWSLQHQHSEPTLSFFSISLSCFCPGRARMLLNPSLGLCKDHFGGNPFPRVLPYSPSYKLLQWFMCVSLVSVQPSALFICMLYLPNTTTHLSRVLQVIINIVEWMNTIFSMSNDTEGKRDKRKCESFSVQVLCLPYRPQSLI